MTIQISSHPDMGRFYTAATDLPRGAVLLSAEPEYYVPDRYSRHKVCSFCLKPPSDPVRPPDKRPNLPFKCSRNCTFVSYCSSSCADNDTTHDLECEFWCINKEMAHQYNSMDAYRQDYTLLLIQALSKRDLAQMWSFCDNFDLWSDDKIIEFTLPSRILAEYATFIAFEYPEMGQLGQKINQRLSSLGVEPSAMLCACMLLVMKEECNSFGLYTYSYFGNHTTRQSYGLAIFCAPVFFNHSCKPNVKHTQIGKKMEFVLQESVKKGTPLSISYIEENQEVRIRKALLKSYFLFDCTCSECTQE